MAAVGAAVVAAVGAAVAATVAAAVGAAAVAAVGAAAVVVAVLLAHEPVVHPPRSVSIFDLLLFLQLGRSLPRDTRIGLRRNNQ